VKGKVPGVDFFAFNPDTPSSADQLLLELERSANANLCSGHIASFCCAAKFGRHWIARGSPKAIERVGSCEAAFLFALVDGGAGRHARLFVLLVCNAAMSR
jgi:hypothetical protein